MDVIQFPWQYSAMNSQTPSRHAGICLRDLRARQKVSQLDLALRVGVSQRHLSCIETGKASASKEMLLALLEGLDAPLSQRNETLVAAGFAPVFGHRPIAHREMSTINQVIDLLLMGPQAAPAMVLDSAWNLVKFNPKSRFFLPPGKDNVFHGMRISASQPADVLVALASQSPFHSALPARPPLIFALLVDRAFTENRQRSLCFAERNGSSVTSR